MASLLTALTLAMAATQAAAEVMTALAAC